MFPNVPHVVTPPQPVAQTAPQPVPPAQSKPVVKPTPAAPAVTQATHAPATPAKPAAPTSTMSYEQFVAAHGPPKPTPAGAPSSSPVSKPRYVPDVGLQDSAEQSQLSQIAAGSGRGTAASPAGTPSASQKSDYLAYLAGRLLEAFTLPPGVSGLKADVTITISPQGRVLKRVISGSSGNKEFDDAVQAAMDLLVNVDPPPPGSPSTFPLTFVPSPR
jgi:TonB family protein